MESKGFRTLYIKHFVSVLPTYVGVFLSAFSSLPLAVSSPHIRGGVSSDAEAKLIWSEVLPTYVGVFLAGYGQATGYSGSPHIRGGVSKWS